MLELLSALLLGLAPIGQPELAAPSPGLAPLPPAHRASAEDSWRGTEAMLKALSQSAVSAAEAGHPLALARLYRLYNLARLVDRTHELGPALERIAAAKRADSLTRDHARFLLVELRLAQNRLDDAHRLVTELGLLTAGQLIGPFDNAAGGGHNEVYPPEERVDLDESARGKGHGVGWRSIAGLAPWGTIHLSALVSPAEEGTAYLAFVARADRGRRAALRIGSSDRLKVFTNGRLIFESDGLRRGQLDQEAIAVQLSRGDNPILIKVSWDEPGAVLLARLTAPDGAKLEGVHLLGDRASVEQAWAAPALPDPSAKHTVAKVTDGIEREVRRTSGRAKAERLALRSDLAAMLHLYDARRLPTPPEADLEAAIRIAPDRPFDRFFYAHRIEDRDPSKAREQLEQAILADDKHVPSLVKLALMARRTRRTVDARSLLEQAIQLDPKYTPAHAALADLLFDNDLNTIVALDLMKSAPDLQRAPGLLSELARVFFELGDRRAAEQRASASLALDYLDFPARRLLLRSAIDSQRLDDAVSLIETEVALKPWRLAPRLERIRLGRARAEPDPSLRATLADLRGRFPDAPEVLDLLAELALAASDRAAAAAALRTSLELDPQRPDVRRHEAVVSGVHAELEDEYGIDALRLLDAPVTPDEREHGAVVLTERTAIRLYDSGQATRFHQTVIRIRNRSLKDVLRVERVGYSPSREVVEILAAERIRPGGEVIKADRITDQGPGGKISGMYVDQRWKQVEFQDLEPGDLIHFKFRVDSVGQNLFGGFFGHVAGAQDRWPIKELVYVAEAPVSRSLYPGQTGGPPPEITSTDGVQTVRWTMRDIDALEMEPMSPPFPEIGRLLSVSTYRSWDDLGRWYARLFKPQLELDEKAREAGKAAIRGAKTDDEKIRRLYHYVIENTRYVGIELGIHGWKPFKASEVHRRRYGDCKDKATLLAALLRDNGIDATIALVRTADKGPFIADHASMWAFNHAITYVPGADLFLDGTAEYSGSRELPWQDQGATVLVVYPDGRTQLKSPPVSKAEDNLNRSSYQVQLGPNGGLKLVGTETFTGATAAPLRSQYSEEERRRERVEQQLAETLPGARVDKAEFSDLGDLEAPVSYTYEAVAPRYALVDEQGRMIMPLTLFQHRMADAYAQLARREQDLEIRHAWATGNRVEYQLPPGLRLAELPPSVSVETPFVSFVQTVEKTDRGFVTDDIVTFHKKRVAKEDYPQFRRACLEIDQILGRKVVLER